MNSLKTSVLVASILFSVYFIYSFNFQINAAAQETDGLEDSSLSNNEYLPGEILFQLKEPIEELSQPIDTPDSKLNKKEFSSLNKDNLPQKLQEIDTKYTISTIEKVFPQAESADKELLKIKETFKDEIDNGTRTIDEEAFLANDLSTLYKILIPAEASVEDVVKELSADPNIEFAEPNYITNIAYTPNDPFYPVTSTRINQWGLENPGRSGGYIADKDIDAAAAWDVHKGSSSTVIAVIDSGIDYTHPDLGGGIGSAYKVKGGYDFVNSDTNPMDDNGHGTHIAGTIAASINNSVGVTGVCPNCKLLAVKTQNSAGSGSVLVGAQGVTYSVTNGARIINISWGNTTGSETLNTAIQNAAASNVVVVAAAGNNNSTAKYYPAAYANVIAVANTGPADTKWSNSNYDDGTKWVDISAPGGNILATSLTGGSLCNTAHESGTPRYAYCSGTSMSAPMVAGVAGLMISHTPSLSDEAVAYRIRVTADNINALNPSYAYKLGAGRINANKAIRSNDIYLTGCENGRCLGGCPATTAPVGLQASNVLAIDYPPGSAPIYYFYGVETQFSWTPVAGTSGYQIRIDDESNSFASCNSLPNNGDGCRDISTPSTSFHFASGKYYKITFVGTNWCRVIYVETISGP